MLHFFILLAVLTGLTSILTFVLYVRARMKEQEEKEKLYGSIHFKTLFAFVVLGVVILVMLSKMGL
ncbi:MAG: hypothetical protein JST58_01260 [Bacteroidetes bacterium]|nr:hypothetical protein [Bacteroidota bacterium]